MKQFKILLLFLFILSKSNAQDTYVDPTVTLALAVYSDNLSDKQNKMIDEQNKLQKAQTWVGTQMVRANQIQDKIYKGLSEVSGTLSNGILVKEIIEELDQCKNYSAEISKMVKTHPQYAVFGVKSSKKTYESVIKIGTDVSNILKSGELNLATAGDRHRLLFEISDNVKTLKIWLIMIKLDIERAINLGFWKAINPFQGYINTDKYIVKDIMERYKLHF